MRTMWTLILSSLALVLATCPAQGAAPATDAWKKQAYELYEQKRFEEAAEQFQRYVDMNPDDVRTVLDFASLLSQLKRHEEAAKRLEAVHQKNPQHEAAYFKLGAEYVTLKRYADAEKVFAELEQSSNRDLATAAADALRRLKTEVAREERLKAEQRVFDLAQKFQHKEVVELVSELEKQSALSFALEMQRLYALQSLGHYATALEKADQFATNYPAATDLALLRADLLMQTGRRVEATAIWRKIGQENTGTAAAAEAARRLQAAAIQEAEMHVYELARQQKHREVLAAINDLEKRRSLSLDLEMQRLYAWHRLGQIDLALKRANELSATYPQSADLAILRADLLIQNGKWEEAAEILRKAKQDHQGTPSAFEAEKRLEAETARRERNRAAENIFELARNQNHRAVIEAIDELEKKEKLDWVMELQRLYALQALGQYTPALERADRLAASNPAATELTFLRAALLARNDRRDEAVKLLERLRQEKTGSVIAAEATQQIQVISTSPAARREEEHIYELANRHEYREVVTAVDELEKKGELSWPIQMQRLYALQALGETARALELADRMSATHPENTDLALAHADLLIHDHQWQEAATLLKQVKRNNPDTPMAGEAGRRLQSIPPVENLDHWYWGEAYLSGDYLGRYGTVVGSGFIRHGTYIPHARWLQPFQEFRFSADTRSNTNGQRSVIADNFTALSFGLRAQPFATEYFYFYVSGGLNKDWLDRRDGGDWTGDYQAGLYGFKSWGPSTVLHRITSGELIPTTGNVPSLSLNASTNALPTSERLLWRWDWFADVGVDFSYYKRYANWIGYAQPHEGVRAFQCGSNLALDLYLVENLSADVRGNYFDNLFEIGPGMRWLWVPHKGWEVVLRTEWLGGFYFGRDDRGTRGNAEGQYDDFRVGLSVGVRW